MSGRAPRTLSAGRAAAIALRQRGCGFLSGRFFRVARQTNFRNSRTQERRPFQRPSPCASRVEGGRSIERSIVDPCRHSARGHCIMHYITLHLQYIHKYERRVRFSRSREDTVGASTRQRRAPPPPLTTVIHLPLSRTSARRRVVASRSASAPARLARTRPRAAVRVGGRRTHPVVARSFRL